MNVRKWVWCLHCERCFEVHLGRGPERDEEGTEATFEFGADFEMQFGVEEGGQVYAECTTRSRTRSSRSDRRSRGYSKKTGKLGQS